jgi:DNA-binding CsgD family transcriptional regulator
MTTGGELDRGRECFGRKAWGETRAHLSAADAASPLEPDDLERLATACYLLARSDECADAWARAYNAHVERNEVERAVRAAFWLAFGMMINGEMAPAGGWFAKAGRLLEDGRDCVERGYLLAPTAVGAMFGGATEVSIPTFGTMIEYGERFRDPNLTTLGRLGRGQSLIIAGEPSEGVPLLDEVMVAVTGGEVSPILAGLAYCGVIEFCQLQFDVRRAQEWTAALSRWCDEQPDLVPYRGQCLVHRTQIMSFHGDWRAAADEANRAVALLTETPGRAVGMAFYEVGELHRLRGHFEEAEEAFRRGNDFGHVPQPGLTLLRLAQGKVDAAATSIRLALEEMHEPMTRLKMLAATVEILLAAGDIAGARAAADQLGSIASRRDVPLLDAEAGRAAGAVLLAEGDARAALSTLRSAWTIWQDLDAPYEAARVRVLLGRACRELGDEDSASMEFDAAIHALESLGAAKDLERARQLARKPERKDAGGLTAREIEVLVLVASGKTNRAIASELVLSEKTVARHVSNIFTKLGVASRSAATAYAYEHSLV